MALSDFLITELDGELPKTRTTLERVPADKTDFVPHAKSMPLGRLAAHVARLGEFGANVLELAELNFETAKFPPLVFTSTAQLLADLESGVARLRTALARIGENAWNEPWTLRMGARVLFTGSRFQAYRGMYANHVVHHRAQIGVYLRLLAIPVPSIYGPTADEPMR